MFLCRLCLSCAGPTNIMPLPSRCSGIHSCSLRTSLDPLLLLWFSCCPQLVACRTLPHYLQHRESVHGGQVDPGWSNRRSSLHVRFAGKQSKKSNQRESPDASVNDGSTRNSPPQVQQQKALQLQPTKKVVRDLENVPRGCPVHGYSLVRGQMLRGGRFRTLTLRSPREFTFSAAS